MKRLLRPITAASDSFEFRIPVTWQVKAVLKVTSRSLQEAIQYVNSHEYELPEGEYVNDSFEIDYDRLEN